MFAGTLLVVIMGALYILFAFVEPPEVIATLFRVPVVAVFFPPEKRMKYGRLTIGLLLIVAGPILSLIPGARGQPSILGAVVAVLILGVLVAARWKRAGEIVDTDDAERRAQWQSFELLKRDPRFVHLQHQLYAKGYRTTFERVSDPVTYRVVYIALWDERCQRLLAQQGAPATRIVAYLEREAAPKRIQACLDLQTGACGESEVGWMGWGGQVPLQPIGA